MKYTAITILLILSLFISSNVFAATGDIQITCETNVRIFIDNNFKGVTNDSDSGLFIEGLTPGRHTLKAVKKGFDPFVREISITANKAIEVKINFGQRQERVQGLQSEEGQTLSQVGKMELRSVPLGAKVTIDGKSYQQKTDMEIENIPIGKHRISFERGNKKLSGLFNLNEQEILKLKAHFKEGRIIDLSKLEREERKAEEIEMEKQRRERAAWERREIDRDGQFIAYANGTVLDTRTNLMWAAKDNGEFTNWYGGKSYCENYSGGGYTDWRMPTTDELVTLYDVDKKSVATDHFNVHLTKLISLSGRTIWASETDGNYAAYVYFANGEWRWSGKSVSGSYKGSLPVRSAKPETTTHLPPPAAK